MSVAMPTFASMYNDTWARNLRPWCPIELKCEHASKILLDGYLIPVLISVKLYVVYFAILLDSEEGRWKPWLNVLKHAIVLHLCWHVCYINLCLLSVETYLRFFPLVILKFLMLNFNYYRWDLVLFQTIIKWALWGCSLEWKQLFLRWMRSVGGLFATDHFFQKTWILKNREESLKLILIGGNEIR